jgi:YgiT-type zinc finger domain-containing protein
MGKPAIEAAHTKKEIAMQTKPVPHCGQHHIAKEWRPTTFEYTEDGITIRVLNIPAWVCPTDGEASFTSETVDELIAAIRDLVESAKRARQRRATFTEYIVSVA